MLRIERVPRVALQITPDTSVRSGRTVEHILQTIHSLRESWTERYWTQDKRLIVQPPFHASWRIEYTHDAIRFYADVPESAKDSVKHSLETVWPKAAIAEVAPMQLDVADSVCGHLELREHYFRATKVARDELAPTPSLMSSIRHLQPDDKAIVDIAFIPLGDAWRERARAARQRYSHGQRVKRLPSKWHQFAYLVGDFAVEQAIEPAFGLLDTMLDAHPAKEPKRQLNRTLTSASEQKYEHAGFEVYIRVAAQTSDPKRSERIVNALGTAFKDVSGDNEWDLVMDDKRIVEHLNEGRLGFFPRGNILSIPEASQLLQLPTHTLQEEFAQIERIELQETDIPAALTQGGIYLGTAKHKKQIIDIYQPVSDYDEVVTSRIVIAPPGQGKTTFAANIAVEAYKNGFGALCIDPGKREMGDMISECIGAENVIRYDFGRNRYNLDWIESQHEAATKGWLANAAVSFFTVEDDMGGQTARFLKAGIAGMNSGKLAELRDIFESEQALQRAIGGVADGMHKTTLQEFASYKPDMRRKIMSPIYNRLDSIYGDEYLSECMASSETIDMLVLMTQPKVVIIDLPDEVDEHAKNIIVHLLITKIDMAMRLREKVQKNIDPYLVIQDEPHQYLRASSVWQKLAVESRKYRVGYTWLFHYWYQLPQGLQIALKNVHANYHLFSGADEAFTALASKMKPFTYDEAMNLPSHHAVNILRVNGQAVKPFIAHMAQPRRIAQ